MWKIKNKLLVIYQRILENYYNNIISKGGGREGKGCVCEGLPRVL